MLDDKLIENIKELVGFDVLGDLDRPILVCDFIQARLPDRVRRPFFAEFDEGAVWFDDLRPAFGKQNFYFEESNEPKQEHLLMELTEMLLE